VGLLHRGFIANDHFAMHSVAEGLETSMRQVGEGYYCSLMRPSAIISMYAIHSRSDRWVLL
jgi:hypothetical protein